MVPVWYFVAIFACVCLSGFFSASEMAYSSANRLRIENAAESGSHLARAACAVLNRYDNALSAILIGNNLVNITASSLASVVAILIGGEKYTALATAIITLLIIIFGESVPKIVAKKNANKLALRFAYIIRTLTLLLKPVVAVVVGLVGLITAPLKGEEIEDEEEAAVEELQSIIETVEDEGVIDEDRSELLQAALHFSNISASEVMTARVDMRAIDIEDDWEDILETINGSHYSRLPVYEESIDNIIGVLYVNHFYKALLDNEVVDIRSLLMEPCYVYKTMKLPGVLNELRKCKMHLAIVTDEYGGAMGVITMEDVMEQIVGEIWDESDEISADVIERGEGLYEIDGDMSISEFLELLEWDEDSFESESSTVGGWTIEMFGAFPEPSQSFTYENITVTVLSMDNLRVEKVLVEVHPVVDEED
ncbi:MAG: hemolysin family protein [Oscillospiraceae bacterium]